MLETDYHETLDRLVQQIPCRVKLPKGWDDFYERSGVASTIDGDKRWFARVYFRQRFILEIGQSLPLIERKRELHSVIGKDISRGGLSFLHFEQLFPKEELKLWLPTQKTTCSVVRCIRYADDCFHIGVAFKREDSL